MLDVAIIHCTAAGGLGQPPAASVVCKKKWASIEHIMGVEGRIDPRRAGAVGTVPSKRVGVHEPRHQKRLIG